MNCDTCRHWHVFRFGQRGPNIWPPDDEDTGECRRYPPQIDSAEITASNLIASDSPQAWAWPITTAGQGCGEYAACPQPFVRRLFPWRGT